MLTFHWDRIKFVAPRNKPDAQQIVPGVVEELGRIDGLAKPVACPDTEYGISCSSSIDQVNC